jgi:hypothetical protein
MLTLEPEGQATGCNPVEVGSIPTGVSPSLKNAQPLTSLCPQREIALSPPNAIEKAPGEPLAACL